MSELRAELTKIGEELEKGYIKKEVLLTRLKAARARTGSLLVPRVRRQTPKAAGESAAAAATKEKKRKAQKPAAGEKATNKAKKDAE